MAKIISGGNQPMAAWRMAISRQLKTVIEEIKPKKMAAIIINNQSISSNIENGAIMKA
jgi:hypothetical protein